MLTFVAIQKKAIYIFCALSECTPACSALIAAIYVFAHMSSQWMQITLGQGPSYILHQRQDVVVKEVFVSSRLHTVLYSAVLCAIAVLVCYSQLTAMLSVCPRVLLLPVLYSVCNIWDRTTVSSCIIVQPSVHPHPVFQSSLSCWILVKVLSLSVPECSAGMFVMQLWSCTLGKK